MFSYISAAVINMSKTKSLIETCLAETGGLGVDCVIDQGGSSVCVSVLCSHQM